MHRADGGDDRHVGWCKHGQLGDLTGAPHAHLNDSHLGVGGQPEDAERHAHLGVAVTRRAGHSYSGGKKHRAHAVFGRGLAV